MPSSTLPNLTNLATPQPTMLLYAALSPFGTLDDRKVTANALLSTITANISDISLQFDNGAATATVSAAGKGKIRYNDTTKTFQVSVDGGAYSNIGGSGMSIGGTVTGGTTGSVLFVGAGPVLAQDNAKFFWDDTNNRLGIGTATPATELHAMYNAANSSTSVAVLSLDNPVGGTQTVMRFLTNGTFRAQLRADSTGGFVLEGSGGDSYLGTNSFGTTRMFIGGTTGNPSVVVDANTVGIRNGNTGINAQLHVESGATTRVGFRVDSAVNSTVDLLQFNLKADDTSTVANLATFDTVSNGTPANGFGSGLTFNLESSTTDGQNASRMQTLWTNATHASRSAAVAFQIVDNAAALAEMWRIAGNGAGTGAQMTITGSNGSQCVTGTITENLTLNTGGTTTDTTMDLPANSIILSVTTRVTTTITTAASFSVGDPTTAARFSASAGGLTAGSTRVGLQQMQGSVATDAAGPVQTTAAKVRITTNVAPGAGAIRITIHFMQFIAPTS